MENNSMTKKNNKANKPLESHFKLKKTTELKDLIDDTKNVILPESDLSFQNETHLFQFDYIKEKKPSLKLKLNTGTFVLKKTMKGYIFDAVELNQTPMLTTNNTAESIMKQFNYFFENLNIYEELDQIKKRSILLYGEPGQGKTATISLACQDLLKNNDTAIILWNSDTVQSSTFLDIFNGGIEYNKDIKKLIIIIEDIGMDVEGYGGPKRVDRSLLGLLDGTTKTFEIPTFIIATTNYAHNLPEPLVRPGRFDEWIRISAPTPTERVALAEFIAKRDLTEEEKNALLDKQFNDFSIAHMKEVIVRSKLNKITIKEALDQLLKHKKTFNSGFEDKKNKPSFGL